MLFRSREFIGGVYEGDPHFREAIQQWLHAMWLEKDKQAGQLLAEAKAA